MHYKTRLDLINAVVKMAMSEEFDHRELTAVTATLTRFVEEQTKYYAEIRWELKGRKTFPPLLMDFDK